MSASYLDPHVNIHLTEEGCKRCFTKGVELFHNICQKCWDELEETEQ